MQGHLSQPCVRGHVELLLRGPNKPGQGGLQAEALQRAKEVQVLTRLEEIFMVLTAALD